MLGSFHKRHSLRIVFFLPVPSYGSLLSSSFTTVFNGVGSSFTMNKLKELTPYCCRVRSRNDAGEGEFSKPKTFYTKAQPPQVIKGKEAQMISSNIPILIVMFAGLR